MMKQYDKFEKLVSDVEEIKTALLGDYRTQGFISETNGKIQDLYYRTADIEKWRNGFENIKIRIVAFAIGILVTGALIGYSFIYFVK